MSRTLNRVIQRQLQKRERERERERDRESRDLLFFSVTTHCTFFSYFASFQDIFQRAKYESERLRDQIEERTPREAAKKEVSDAIKSESSNSVEEESAR